MKAILILLFLSLSFFATADQSAEVQCNIENYQDFIDKLGVHSCNLRGMIFRDEPFVYSLFEVISMITNKAPLMVDLKWANLKGADLQDADLERANLIGADLSWANLKGADLTGAWLYKSYVRVGDLFYTYLYGTKFKGADLTEAIVTKPQAKYLTAKGLSGFVVVE